MSARARKTIARLSSKGGSFTSTQVATATGLSRQAIHRLLARLVSEGALRVDGAGRATRYGAPGPRVVSLRKRLRGLEEDRVWQEAEAQLPGLPPRTQTILQYAFTEMLNNAIDHSGSATAELRLEDGPVVAFEIVDRGVGAFENVRKSLGLGSALEAAQELTKGKVTTLPRRHTGEGIFFTSRIADCFELDSGGVRWVVDGPRDEWALGTAPSRTGTRVRFEIARDTDKELAGLFNRFTHELGFDRTQIRIKLFEHGTRFVSRSEAKRLLRGLERFRTVVLDFKGVELVGQGFADEVFRVWARAHAKTEIVPEAMGPAVTFLVERARDAQP